MKRHREARRKKGRIAERKEERMERKDNWKKGKGKRKEKE